MTRLSLLTRAAVVVALPLVAFITIANAQNTTSNSGTNCKSADEAIMKCKAEGRTYTRGWDNNQCAVITCGPVFMQTTTNSTISSSSSSTSNCATSSADVAAKAASCKAQDGYQPVVRFNNGCYEYIDCVKRTNDSVEQSRSSSSVPKEGVLCRKVMSNGCVLIRCEDGFTWNSCTEAVRKFSSSSSSKSFSSAPVRTNGTCSDIEKQMNDARAAYKASPNEASRKRLSAIETQFKICSNNQLNSPTGIPSSCTTLVVSYKEVSAKIQSDPGNPALLQLRNDLAVKIRVCMQQTSSSSSSTFTSSSSSANSQ